MVSLEVCRLVEDRSKMCCGCLTFTLGEAMIPTYVTTSHMNDKCIIIAEAISRGGCSFSLSDHLVVAEWTDMEWMATATQIQ